MPTFTAIALENLLEPRVRGSYQKPFNLNPSTDNSITQDDDVPSAPRHIYISPALYTTPEPAPIPDNLSEPLSPSPYVVNHKRRGGGARTIVNRRSNNNGFEEQQDDKEIRLDDEVKEEVVEENFGGNGNLFEDGEIIPDVDVDEEEEHGFLDSMCESASVGSVNEMRQFDCRSFMSAQGEFFDAVEDFSSDNSVVSAHSYGRSVESELHALRVSLLEEIERRKTAEESLGLMQSHWQRLHNLLSEAGLTFPRCLEAGGSMLYDSASVEELSQEVVVTRFVVEAIGKGQARAEAELAAELILESKDQEISRLRDRLQYYETMNHEMSQRNLEIFDVARKQRRRRKTQRRWFWSCIGLSVAVGISFVGYSYMPGTSKHLSSSNVTDTSDIGTPDA